MILGVTGHRPHKLGGYHPEINNRLIDMSTAALQEYQPRAVVIGMALGFDMAMAWACVNLRIPFCAALPFTGQESRWPSESQREYHHLLRKAHAVVVVCEPGYEKWKMDKRNEFIVDNCTHLAALWDGTNSGTGDCVTYAQKLKRPTVNLWQTWLTYQPRRHP